MHRWQFFLSSITIIFITGSMITFGQNVPKRFSYQAVVRNENNEPMQNQLIGTKISILQGAATGAAVYVETHAAMTNSYGLVSLEIGAGQVQSGTFAGIDWSNGPFFIKTEKDPLGGNNYTISGTAELLSVPFALYAANSQVGPQGPVGPKGDKGDKGEPGIGLANGSFFGQMMFWNGTIWDTLNPGKQGQMLLMCDGKPTWSVRQRCPRKITGISCNLAVQYGTLVSGIQSNGTTVYIPYSGGNDGGYEGQSFPSAGVTGLTATLYPGYFWGPVGQVGLNITGTPAGAGTASFQINIGGLSCILEATVYPQASVGSLQCQNAIPSDSVFKNIQLTDFTIRLPYSNGNGGVVIGQSLPSSGVPGLIANIPLDTLSAGNGELILTISGTPQSAGLATFPISIGGINCTLSLQVFPEPASVSMITCPCPNDNAGLTGVLSLGNAASGVLLRIPYNGSNGGLFSAQTITSTGITGLTAQLTAGILNSPNGELVYSISGTPQNPGKSAIFNISIGGKSCTAELNVEIPAAHASCEPVNVLNPMLNYESMQDQDGNSYKTIKIGGQTWMAENLRTTHNNAGQSVGSANSGLLSGCRFGMTYNYAEVMNSSGICPAGWHVPSAEEWIILENQLGGNQVALSKLISAYPQNFSSSNGYNNSSGLSLVGTGYIMPQCTMDPPPFNQTDPCQPMSGGYWTTSNKNYVFNYYFNYSNSFFLEGFSTCNFINTAVRCVKNPTASEIAQIQTLNCSAASNAGVLVSGIQAAAAVSITLPYTGGNGGVYFSQSVVSEGVSGLTASLAPGTLQNGSGNLVWQISGTPQGSGTATFTLSFAGKTCQISRVIE